VALISGSKAVDFDAVVGTCEKALFVTVGLEVGMVNGPSLW
jgi:hypothetical protein